MSVGDYLSKGLGYVLPGYGDEGKPAGVAGPASAGQPVVYDPGTGLYLNKATGAVSYDAGGQNVVSDPSLATQAARNLATSQQFLSTLGQYGAQYNATQKNEDSLGAHLNATIAGTAPSVAQSQIVQQQQSQASGATGEAGAASRVAAMGNTANAQAATNAATAGIRANEVAGAENALGGLYSNQANQALTGSGQAITGAGNFSGLAGTEEQNNDTLTQSGGKNQLTTIGTLASAGGSAAGIGGGKAPSTDPGSDENMKTNIKPADMDEFMSKLGKAIAFDYKSPGEPGTTAKRVDAGVTAQNVKKSKVGKSIVKGSEPDMHLDGVQSISAALAGIADLHKRLKKVESRG